MKRFIYILICPLIFAFAGCRDDLMPDLTIGEGTALISATMDFKPMVPALKDTRSPGNSHSEINSLHVLIYDAETKELAYKWKIRDFAVTGAERYDKDADNGHSAEEVTKQATFKLPDAIKFGRYNIYAVANIPDLLTNEEYSFNTVDELKGLTLVWDPENISNNAQMLGSFSRNPGETQDEIIAVNEKTMSLHAWLRRAASKVTVAYDGSKLKDGVTIYIMGVSIKDIPAICPLGMPNTPKDTYSLIHDGEMIKYYEGNELPTDFVTSYGAKITNKSPYYGSDHSSTADALFFYENMQGKGKGNDKLQKDEDKDGVPDNQELSKNGKPYGTYIEVDAIYRSDTPEYKGTGSIKYRFMLGKNKFDDFNAERNYHYKLTLKFNNSANDYDWNIEYKEDILEVTEPTAFNYQGKTFIPEYRPQTANYNYGHNFTDRNTVTVSSYIEDSGGELEKWEILYDENGDNQFTKECSWLEPIIEDGPLPYIKDVSFKVKSTVMIEKNIDEVLRTAPQKGSSTAPYNLADPGKTVDPKDAKIKCTANCYMVDAPGYYILPLIYGNAYHNYSPNSNAYTFTDGTTTDPQILAKFKDYLGNEIKSPYIKNAADARYTPQSAFLIWQDEMDLISYSVWDAQSRIEYLPDAYGGVGGIKFYVDKGTIQQGNAVIGISNEPWKHGTIDIPPVMWSWHIWVTNFNFLEKDDETIEVTGHNPEHKFKFMPVNLGWCSNHSETVKYYPARKCTVRFKTGKKHKDIIIEQKSHFAYTRGNNPYYQWGRKDPFVGAHGNKRDETGINALNKKRFFSAGDWGSLENPSMFSPYEAANDARYTTRKAVDEGVLIRFPRIWHNPKRKINPNWIEGTDNVYKFVSDNDLYVNLWQGRRGVAPGSPTLKTVYDPSPVGYQVPHYEAFSGFTTTGKDTNTDFEWYDAKTDNIAQYNQDEHLWENNKKYTEGLYEFYVNPDKMQSIIFPESGYRDWDDYARVYQILFKDEPVNTFGPIGYAWSAGNKDGDDNRSYNFEFSRRDYRKESYIRPMNHYFPCDGFPIRPCLYDNHNAN